MSAFWPRLKPYLLLALLALPALWPLAGPANQVPRTNDTLAHLYRTVALDPLFRAGVLFPRWSPNLVLGYGYPVFNFFPYLSHALVAALHLLGLALVPAYSLACALALLASAVFAFQLGREHFGPAAGLIAGTAYLYSPYLLYDTYIRGSLPESLALALLPMALLHLGRAARGRPAAGAWGALALAGAILAHQGVMLQAIPFVIVYAAWQAIEHRLATPTPERSLRAAGPWLLTAGILLSLALSAFFWLPALAESGFVQISRGTGNAGMSYQNNFLSLAELLALPRHPVDADLLNPPVVRSLPLAALLIAALALLRWGWPVVARRFAARAPEHTRLDGSQWRAIGWRAIAFLLVAALAATLLLVPLARPLWDVLPLLKLTLFPWRLLGPISLFVALAAGAVATAPRAGAPSTPSAPGPRSSPLTHWSRSVVFLFLPVMLLVVAGLPFASPPRQEVPADPTLADLAGFEIPPDFIGSTTVGEYLPIWVQQLPAAINDDRERLQRGEPVSRYNAPGAAVTPGPARVLGAEYNVASPEPLTFVYRVFYFPGWRAALDGQSVPIQITTPDGLMSVAIPAGAHSLSFTFGSTPVRWIGDFLSLLGLVALAAWLVLARRAVLRAAPIPAPEWMPAGFNLSSAEYWGLFALAGLLALARPWLYDAGRTPLLIHGLAAPSVPGPTQPLDQSFAGEVRLLGASLPAQPVSADEPLPVTLYWRAEHPLGVAYGFQLSLVDEAGHVWTKPASERPRDWRFSPGTDFWPADQYILDPYLLTLLPGTPPGVYSLLVDVFARYNLQSLGPQPAGQITVGAPGRARQCLSELSLATQPALELRSAAVAPASATPGDDVTLSLCWRAVAAPGADLAAELRLVDSTGALIVTRAFTLGGAYPSSRWAAGDAILDQVTARLPPSLASGRYTWQLSVAGGAAVPVGEQTIAAPQRLFTAPPVDASLNAILGPLSLYGLLRPAEPLTPGGSLALTLVWRAEQTPADSYSVFVHLQDSTAALVAQSDGVPANWTRRTTGWLPGEYVLDPRSLSLPPDLLPGQYSLFAGLYLPATGARLTSPAYPDGRVPLGTVEIGGP